MNKFLHQFRVVAEQKNLTAASQLLHLSQPALTKNIKKVEEEFGVPLFERLPRGMLLTPFGEALLHRVKRMEMEYRYAHEEVSALQSGATASLNIGSGPVWALNYLPDILSQLYQRFPKLSVKLESGSMSVLLPKLASGELDLALGTQEVDEQLSDELKYIHMIDVDLIVVARRNHPLAHQATVSAEEVSRYRWVLFMQSLDQIKQYNHFFLQHGLPPIDICLQSDYWTTALAMLHQGDYLMSMPKQLLQQAMDNGLVQIAFVQKIWGFSSGIWYAPTARSLPAVNEFINFMIRDVRDADPTNGTARK
ncbi:LysR family transcriptional regulator [Marinobacterium rhizophilum]|uniref:LysR family transcriptional regulator n=1 Tax=Marinobacterium rhizophilum TaxID=420402 RepID=A0ABY5HG03_9GAMM|nr:LysR family transcriptional regulator [Marinobacterium rhizophilum]UTW11215.1 LysR family transcriptional regulator [Marinobacterium rhizophilum]